jgi:hypothetical protein
MRKSLLAFSFILLSFRAFAQEPPAQKPPLRERLFFGGNFALQFGTYTNIEIDPIIGFWILPRLAVAAGPTYIFYKFDNVRTDIYGGRCYVQYVLFRDIDRFIPLGVHSSIILHVEDEVLSLDSGLSNSPIESDRFTINTLLGGFGLSQQIGRRGSVNLMVLWTLSDSGYQIYSNPEIRIGFTF